MRYEFEKIEGRIVPGIEPISIKRSLMKKFGSSITLVHNVNYDGGKTRYDTLYVEAHLLDSDKELAIEMNLLGYKPKVRSPSL